MMLPVFPCIGPGRVEESGKFSSSQVDPALHCSPDSHLPQRATINPLHASAGLVEISLIDKSASGTGSTQRLSEDILSSFSSSSSSSPTQCITPSPTATHAGSSLASPRLTRANIPTPET
ncbi:hypothetical protein E2C01_028137 [Portunus trituberculatus]|uniref:Uncharacterized protein n=1 Tax=Portunus trituberculatus TaxID=210409 RepID=A0A5B7ENE4_PORTR|nr:hypothetical protein [Portunus trituberculatus]